MSVRCPDGHENPHGSRFCRHCGAAIATGCGHCGAALPSDSRYCNHCGAAQGEAASARAPRDYTPPHLAQRILTQRAALEGERKQVTVLFCDVKSSVALSGELDPEAWHGVLDGFFRVLNDGVHRFEGTVNQYTGDGIMALFGAPLAHEDHAQRACYAALHLRETLAGHAERVKREHGLVFSTRIGLHSGEVVVGKIGDDLRMDYTAQGQVVGIAARMQELAEPGSAYLTGESARRVEGYVELRDAGEYPLRGTDLGVHAYRLEGLGRLRTRLDRARARGFSRFVGRDEELQTLELALGRALAGEGQVVAVVGEAGVGKSRLCLEFAERARARGAEVHEGHCPSHGRTLSLHLVRELLADVFGIADRDGVHEARRKAAGELQLADPALLSELPLLFELLGVADQRTQSSPIDPDAGPRRIAALVAHLVPALAQRTPRLILLDDLHWIDPGSDALLGDLVNAVAGTRTLLLANFRPEYDASWVARAATHRLPLVPFGGESARELLEHLMGSDPSVASLAERVLERTRGNALFLEETVHALVESGALEGEPGSLRARGPVEAIEVPETVQDVLAARIDRLDEDAKQVLQAASVLGHTFPEPLLAEVVEEERLDLAAGLDRLAAAELLFEQQLYPELVLGFKHPLVEAVAYGSQLLGRRREIHRRAAHALVRRHMGALDEHAALLAHHFKAAGELAQAASFAMRAADGSLDDQSASRHAEDAREMGAALGGEKGIAIQVRACERQLISFRATSDSRERLVREGRALAGRSGDRGLLPGLLATYATRLWLDGEAQTALTVLDEALSLAEAAEDPAMVSRTCMQMIGPLRSCGDLAGSLRAADRALELPAEHRERAGRLAAGQDVVHVTRFNRARTLIDLGRLDEAEDDLERAARERAGRFAGALPTFRALLDSVRGAPELAIQRLTPLVELLPPGAPFFFSSRNVLAEAYLEVGDVPRALRVLESWQGESEPFAYTSLGATLGRAHIESGSVEAGLAQVERSTRHATQMQARTSLIELAIVRATGRRRQSDARARSAAEQALDDAERLIAETGALRFTPIVELERAALAEDSTERRRALERARQAFSAMSALRRVDDVDRQLAELGPC